MTCTGYDPRQVIQLDGVAPVFDGRRSLVTFDGSDCGCATTAMCLDDATCGAKRTTATRIRELMNDRVGGTNLGQADEVLSRYFGVDLEVRYRLPWAEYERIRLTGRGAYLQGGYAPIADSRFSGSETFRRNHGMYDPPSGKVLDPLADGRRPGIYKYQGEVYPRALMRRFAGLLNLEPDPRKPPRYLGDGLVYCGFTRDNDAALPAYAVTMEEGVLDWWRVVDNLASRAKRGVWTAGFTRRCTAPKRYLWPGHTMNGLPLYVSLVRLLDGPHEGKWLATNSPRLTLKEV